MASTTMPPHSFAADDNDQSRQAISSWLSTPRSTPQDLTALVKTSMQHAVSRPPASPLSKAITQRSRPQCTHMTMNRLYGEHTCQQCGKVPNLGWVYSCQQDHDSRIRSNGSNGTSTETLPLVPDHGNYFDAQAEIARSLGMSASVIKQMRAGEYSYEQIETLLAQRRRVKEVIRQAEHPSARSTPPSPERLPDKVLASLPSETIIASAGLGIAPAVQQDGTIILPMSPAGTPYNTPADSTSSTPTKKHTKRPKCHYQVCHACRPFFQDRLPMNVDSVLNDEVPAVTPAEIAKLPVRDTNVVRNIGFRQSPQLSAMGRPHGDESTEDSTPTTASSAWTDSTSEPMPHDDPYPCPGAGRCPVYSLTEGCAYELGFDDGNRATNHGFVMFDGSDGKDGSSSALKSIHGIHGSISDTPSGTSSTGSSISLPDAVTAPLTPPTPTDSKFGFGFIGDRRFGKKAGKAATICGEIDGELKRSRIFDPFGVFRNDSRSSLGSEVEVEGGVALTEEAVESGMPDIVTNED